MKKLLIAIGTILIMVCVVILFVNANGARKVSQKAKTEAAANKASGSGSAACCPAGADKTTASDPATSPAKQEGAQMKAQDCGQMSSCTATCGSKTTGAK